MQEASSDADKFLESLVEDTASTVDVDEDADEIDGLANIDLTELLPDPESTTLPFESQAWVDYATEDDFNKLFLLD